MNNNYNQPAVSSTPALVFGILSLAFSESGLLAIIFGAIARSKAKNYLAANGVLDGKAKAGKILGTIGLVFGIISLVVVVIFIFAVIAGAASGSITVAN